MASKVWIEDPELSICKDREVRYRFVRKEASQYDRKTVEVRGI